MARSLRLLTPTTIRQRRNRQRSTRLEPPRSTPELSGPAARGWPDGPPGRQQHHRAQDRADDAAWTQRQPVPAEQADQQPPDERPGQTDDKQLGPVDRLVAARSRCAIQPANMPHTKMNSRITDAPFPPARTPAVRVAAA